MNHAKAALTASITLCVLSGCNANPPERGLQAACDCDGPAVQCDFSEGRIELTQAECGENSPVNAKQGDVVENHTYEGGENNTVGPR